MSFWDAASLAAAITIALIGFAANKILDVDFTVFFRRNWKRTKCKKMLAQRKGPWQGTNVQGEIRRAFDLVLLPLGKADKALLPARMDKNFRRRMEGQIELLQRRKLCRDIRMTDIVPLPKNSFRHWNDDGREWRESVLQCSALERLLSPAPAQPQRGPAHLYHLPEKRPPPAAPVQARPQLRPRREADELLRPQRDHQLPLLRGGGGASQPADRLPLLRRRDPKRFLRLADRGL